MLRRRSVLFQKKSIGPVSIMNRFIRSATWDAHGDENGLPEDEHFEMLVYLAQGMVGLICPTDMEVNPKVRNWKKYGINGPEYVEAWNGVLESIHTRGNKIMFQLNHIGPERPSVIKDGDKELTDSQINDYISMYTDSAVRAVEAGADGVQLHAAHGFFLSSFLSPALNRRNDKWGGCVDNRIRIIREITTEIRKKITKPFFLSVKLNGSDIDPKGLTPTMSGEIVHKLSDIIDLFEISCNITTPYHQIASNFNKDAIIKGIPKDRQDEALSNAKKRLEGVKFVEEFNRPYLETIRKMNPNATLALVGGNRRFSNMEKLVSSGLADFVSLSRPLLKNPFLIKEMYEGTTSISNCINCGSCLLNSNIDGVYCRINEEKIW